MLDPAARTLLLEALRPPEGYELHSAIGTTFSLDLIALLMVPLAFTRFDYQGDDGRPNPDPLALLEAVRRHSDRLTVFCQAGQIGVPRDMHRLYTYLEGSIVEVAPPDRKGVFHPKLWLLRYSSPDDLIRYRLLCLTRNLTLDRSWDAMLALEGDLRVERQAGYARNRLLGDFVAALPGFVVRPLAEETARRVQVMQEELRRVEFELPDGVEDLQFWPLGTPNATAKGMGEDADRLLVVSPFLSEERLTRLGNGGSRNVLVSRQEELDRLPPACLENYEEVYVLSPLANEEPSGEEELATTTDLLTGLHAKLLLGEFGRTASLWIGSANATTAAIARNVEFMIELQGKRGTLGIDSLFDRQKGETSFADLLQRYTPPDEPVDIDPVQERLDQLVNELRSGLATSDWQLEASQGDSDSRGRYRLVLRRLDATSLDWDESSLRVLVWPVSLRREAASQRLGSPLAAEIDFGIVSSDALTALVAFEVIAAVQGQELACQFAINVPLIGGPTDRREAVLRALLRDKRNVLRFLLFLLASDIETLDGDLDFFGTGESGGALGRSGRDDFPLLESLVRSLDRDPAKLDAVASLVAALQKTEESQNLLPDSFAEVWAAVWTARQELGR